MKFAYLSLAILLSITACSKNDSTPEPQRQRYEGDVRAKALEIYSQQNTSLFYACDRRWKEAALEISASVEANRAFIEEIGTKFVPNRPGTTSFFFGPIEFIDRNKRKPSSDEWTEDRVSWEEARHLYETLKSDPRNPKWWGLNSIVRSLIMEDENRILRLWHPGLRRSEGERVLRVARQVQDCKLNPDCAAPTLVAEDAAWLKEGRYDSYLLSEVQSTRLTFREKRQKLERLDKHLSLMAERYAFHVNPILSVLDGTLNVPMDLEVFKSGASQAIEFLEKTWAVHGLKLRIRPPSAHETPFAIQVSKTPGQRAFVNHSKKLLQLFTPVPNTTFAHEFGHVLGLTDTYYTHFDQTSCTYVYEQNDGDIMSSSSTGSVLPTHIHQIKAAYQLQ
jgi:hypothetical protein